MDNFSISIRAAGAMLAISLGNAACAETPPAPQPTFSAGQHFQQRTGEAIYRAVCQACHMPNGTGARGAGAFPALANNPRLEAAAYPELIVLNGRNGMPALAELLDDDQISSVVDYVRTHFGNRYTEATAASQVHDLRAATGK